MVEWTSLWIAMREMGFPERYIFLVKSCVTSARFSVNINGSLTGWFRSTRGLRQGDPLSSYLFIIILEVFNGLMKNATTKTGFKFHPECEKLGITHLSFADDMVILLAADRQSFKIVKDTLYKFGELTGLKLNSEKSSIYYGSTQSELKSTLSQYMNIEEKQLPMKYLGVPLTSKKFTSEDFSALTGRICAKIGSWQSKNLSMSARAQLIRSSIFGVQNFWCTSFPIPKYVIQETERKIRTFLWKGNDEGKYHAKVSWRQVCLPRAEGGLGFKLMEEWSETCMCKLIWDIASRKESLWIRWIHSNRLKDTSIWEYQKKKLDPWYWKQMLRVRDKMYAQQKAKVGRGDKISFWFDNWTPYGMLWKWLDEHEKSSLQVPSSAKMREVLPLKTGRSRSVTDKIRQLIEYTETVQVSQKEDSWEWIGSREGEPALREIWEGNRTSKPKVAWAQWVWSRHGVPRHECVTWTLMHGKLSTKDRLIKWGMNVRPECVFCKENESQEHLFFGCKYTAQVWRLVLLKLGIYRAAEGWEKEQQWCLQEFKGKALKQKLKQVAFMGTIYEVWAERNGRIYGKDHKTQDTIYFRIINGIQERASTWRKIARTKANWKVCLEWGIDHSIFSLK